MPKNLKKVLLFTALGLVIILLVITWFYYWNKQENIRYEKYESAVEYTQGLLFDDQTMLLDKFTTSTNLNLKNIKSQKYHVHFGILMYHHIDDKNKKFSVSQENLDSQIKFLLDNDYKFIKLSDAFKIFASSSTTTVPYDKTLVLTFDDGYRDFYTNAYPVLKKYNVPAGLYVINQDIGKPGNVNWDMIKQLHQEGLVEIGVHTVNHLALGNIKPDVSYYQMSKSKELLEAALGNTVDTIVYPFGVYNANVEKQAKEIGFIGAASVYFGGRPSSKDLYNWRRVMINNSDIGPLLLRKLYVAFEVVK